VATALGEDVARRSRPAAGSEAGAIGDPSCASVSAAIAWWNASAASDVRRERSQVARGAPMVLGCSRPVPDYGDCPSTTRATASAPDLIRSSGPRGPGRTKQTSNGRRSTVTHRAGYSRVPTRQLTTNQMLWLVSCYQTKASDGVLPSALDGDVLCRSRMFRQLSVRPRSRLELPRDAEPSAGFISDADYRERVARNCLVQAWQ
jgi:hypothetical protein